MTIPFLDLRAANAELRAQIDAALAEVLESGQFILGPQLEQFETEFAAYVGTDHCLGVASGLDALELALRGAGIGPGDEVIVPANTFVATWLAVSRAGATPVPVDPDEVTHNLGPEGVLQAITRATRAVIAVHLYGQPADVEGLRRALHGRNIWIIEDAAQAHGAAIRGVRAGALGDIAAWSFYPAKNLGALGDGGAVTTSDPVAADNIRLLRNYGSRTKYTHEVWGVNSRLDEIQAAVLRIKLRHLDEWNARRRSVAARYMSALAHLPIGLPTVPVWADPVWHLFVIRSQQRERLAAHLAEAGIATQIHYPVPPHKQPAYRHLVAQPLPIAERLAAEVLSLPMGPHLSAADTELVAEMVESFH